MLAPPCFGPFREASAAATTEYVSVPGCDDTGCECGVVAAAVFHMENQRQIQHVGLHHGVILIRTEQTQQILSAVDRFLIRTVDIHASSHS